MNAGQIRCVTAEAAMSDYREGTLPPAEAAAMRAHLTGCRACTELYAAMGAVVKSMRALPAAEPPARLVETILAQTLPRAASPAGLAAGRGGWRALFASPRFALSAAMTVFTLAVVINTAQINLRQMFRPGWTQAVRSQLAPSRLLEAGDRALSRAWARGVSYYNDLRVVYEIEAAVNQMRQPAPPPPAPGANRGQRGRNNPNQGDAT